ncbi:MAG: DUF308 domain-containing protein [Lachnospiraceae bacterium]|nr:DUF308 domain-containing protein [Lachnospiraceae bacterium]
MSKNNNEELKSKFTNILKLIIIVALGLVLVFYPGQAIDTALKALGIGIIVAGVVALISALSQKDKSGYIMFQLIGAIIGIIAGIIIIANRNLVESIFPVLTGVGLSIYGAFGIAQALTFRKYYSTGWQISLFLSAVTIIIGIIIASNPNRTVETVVRLIGIVLIYNGIVGIYMQLNRRKKNLVYNKNEVIDVEAIDVDDEDD